MLFIVMTNSRLHKIIQEAIYNVVNEDHLKVVDNIDAVIAWVEENWTGPDDMWWIKIDQRKKDFRNCSNLSSGPASNAWGLLPTARRWALIVPITSRMIYQRM